MTNTLLCPFQGKMNVAANIWHQSPNHMLSHHYSALWQRQRREFRGWNCAAGWGTNSGALAMMEEGAGWNLGKEVPCNGSCWGGSGKKRFLLYPDGSSFHIWFFEFCLYTNLIPRCHWWACQWRQLVTRAEMVRCPLPKFKGRPGSPPATSKSGLPTPPVQCL